MYVPGKLIPMADALFRNLKNSEDKEEDQISLPILAVNYITGNYQQYPDKPIIDLQMEKHFQRNYTLTGIIEMNFPWRMVSC